MNLWPENEKRPDTGCLKCGGRRLSRRRPVFAAVAAGAVLALAAASCSSGGSGTSSSSSNQVAASAKQTIVFATQGLGGEGTATTAAIKAFEKLHPNITVQILSLSPTSNVALQQLQQRFISGSSTPDVITTDVTWPATFARSGWIAKLNSFHPNTATFFPAQIATGSTTAVCTRSRGSSTPRECITAPT